MVTTTTNYGLLLPAPLSPTDQNVWGGYLNTNTSTADTYYLSLANNFIGTSQPTIPSTSTPAIGQFWINNTVSTSWPVQVYDGSNWLVMGVINPVAHTFTTSSGGLVPRIFTSTNTYTPTGGISYAIIECWGAGGGGGGIAGNASSNGGGGGGGAGAYSKTYATIATIGASQTVTVGSAGAGGSAGNNSGGNGGATSVGTLCIANGGFGGGGSSGTVGFAGIGGIIGTGNLIAAPGQNGGTATGGATTLMVGLSGDGGSSIVGSGGHGVVSGVGNPNAGVAGLGYGAGGSGASGSGTTNTAAGGAGTGGYVLITEFF